MSLMKSQLRGVEATIWSNHNKESLEKGILTLLRCFKKAGGGSSTWQVKAWLVFDWLVILMMKKENKAPPQESQLLIVKREQDINHRPATIQGRRTTSKPRYRKMEPWVSQRWLICTVWSWVRFFFIGVKFHKGCPGVGLVLDRSKNKIQNL